ncbi:DNA-binding transcriptional MerR regulator/SAM-dependent methyltransferase [Desulfobaculum xiamenense]|uniref:DNA-binding transcriptional MerR regulator/SAM-dependent methyltransferase n=1 Tax=Desulfobaculum xiamenense TaxID=995050 RepID=A0A846QVE1_9BACT|nr:MerR family transcriptional regulator [Desulfobaculum xiamenense]NJB69084.1 DNA-binding transcriptional MerR regulator/SAM-dependent methyltransferase [Desulfobaculum xiamenense]
MGYTVGRLAGKFGLARSTLLYYERIGLLAPSERTAAGYRLYSAEDAARLSRICRFRDAGVPLREIADILVGSQSDLSVILETRLRALDQELERIRFQQEFIARLLRNREILEDASERDEETWQKAIRASGLTDESIRRWHEEFASADPEGHRAFLRALGYPVDENDLIQTLGKAPHHLRRINIMSERFMEIFMETLSPLTLQGPSGREHTLRALRMIPELPQRPRIADIGCGTGLAALILAQETDGVIEALDSHKPFLERLESAAAAKGLTERIKIIHGDMAALPFAPESLDVIWAEGSAFIIGFDRALEEWRPLLKDGGCLCISELAWLTDNPSREAAEYWQGVYPEMRTINALKQAIAERGYTVIGSFTLAESAWRDYYAPFPKRLAEQRLKYAGDEEALAVLDNFQAELDAFEKFREFYGYEFLVARKAD